VPCSARPARSRSTTSAAVLGCRGLQKPEVLADLARQAASRPWPAITLPSRSIRIGATKPNVLIGLDFNIEVIGFEMGEIDLRIASLDINLPPATSNL
jgi:hypothetical protein